VTKDIHDTSDTDDDVNAIANDARSITLNLNGLDIGADLEGSTVTVDVAGDSFVFDVAKNADGNYEFTSEHTQASIEYNSNSGAYQLTYTRPTEDITDNDKETYIFNVTVKDADGDVVSQTQEVTSFAPMDFDESNPNYPDDPDSGTNDPDPGNTDSGDTSDPDLDDPDNPNPDPDTSGSSDPDQPDPTPSDSDYPEPDPSEGHEVNLDREVIDTLITDDSYLADGTQGINNEEGGYANSDSVEGSFSLSLNGLASTVTIARGDDKVTLNLDTQGNGTVPSPATIQGDYGTLTITGIQDGKVSYTYTQTEAYHHANASDHDDLSANLAEQFKVTVNDGLNDPFDGYIEVAIEDDGPAISGLDGYTGHAGTGDPVDGTSLVTLSDTFTLQTGADSNNAEITFTLDGKELSFNEQADQWEGEDITVKLTDTAANEYTYTYTYDSANVPEDSEHTFTATVTDGDGDTATQSVDIVVKNEAPVAKDDVFFINKEGRGENSQSVSVSATLGKNSDGDYVTISVLGESTDVQFNTEEESGTLHYIGGKKAPTSEQQKDFRKTFFEDLVGEHTDLTDLANPDLLTANIVFVNPKEYSFDQLAQIAKAAAGNGKLLYINGDLDIPADKVFNLQCVTILNGDLTVDADSFGVHSFLYVTGNVTVGNNVSMEVAGGLAVEGDLNGPAEGAEITVEQTATAFTPGGVTVTYTEEAIPLGEGKVTIRYDDLLNQDSDPDSHGSKDGLTLTEFTITDKDGEIHTIEAGESGTVKIDVEGGTVVFDHTSKTITVTSDEGRRDSINFEYGVKDAHGATDTASVAVQVTAHSPDGSVGNDIIQGATVSIVEGGRYNIAISLDRSSSMEEELSNALKAVKAYLLGLVKEVNNTDSVVNLHFNAFDGDLEGQYKKDWSITKENIENAGGVNKYFSTMETFFTYDNFKGGSGTNYTVAFQDMVKWFTDNQFKQNNDSVEYTSKAIFITDGDPYDVPSEREAALQNLKKLCHIDAVGIKIGSGTNVNKTKLDYYDTDSDAQIVEASGLTEVLTSSTSNLPMSDAIYSNKGDDVAFGDQVTFKVDDHELTLAEMVKELSGKDDPSAADILETVREHAVEINNALIDGSNDQPDAMIGGEGTDVLFGMGGNDLIIGDGPNSLTEGDAMTKLEEGLGISEGKNVLTRVENITKAFAKEAAKEDGIENLEKIVEKLESPNDSGDLLFGNSGDDVLLGLGGDDYLNGGEGKDLLFGGSGNDILVYDSNDVAIVGGSGIDFLVSDDPNADLEELLKDGNVDGIEVLISGEGAENVTSLTELGIKIETRDGQHELSLDTNKWNEKDGNYTYTDPDTGNDLTLQLDSNFTQQSDSTDEITFILNTSQGG